MRDTRGEVIERGHGRAEEHDLVRPRHGDRDRRDDVPSAVEDRAAGAPAVERDVGLDRAITDRAHDARCDRPVEETSRLRPAHQAVMSATDERLRERGDRHADVDAVPRRDRQRCARQRRGELEHREVVVARRVDHVRIAHVAVGVDDAHAVPVAHEPKRRDDVGRVDGEKARADARAGLDADDRCAGARVDVLCTRRLRRSSHGAARGRGARRGSRGLVRNLDVGRRRDRPGRWRLGRRPGLLRRRERGDERDEREHGEDDALVHGLAFVREEPNVTPLEQRRRPE